MVGRCVSRAGPSAPSAICARCVTRRKDGGAEVVDRLRCTAQFLEVFSGNVTYQDLTLTVAVALSRVMQRVGSVHWDLLFHLSSFEKAFVNLVNLRTEVLESTHLSYCCRMIVRLLASGCRTRFRGIRSKLTVPKGNAP